MDNYSTIIAQTDPLWTLLHMALNILKCNTTRKASLKRKRQMAP